MGCDIIFRFVGKGASGDNSEASPIILQNTSLQSDTATLSNVVLELLDEKFINKRQELASTLQTQEFLGFYKITEDVLNTQGVIGNTNLSELKKLHPEIGWTECSDIPEILLVRSLSINGQKFSGRILEGGREIFVVQDDELSLTYFSRYLQQRDIINKRKKEINADEKLIDVAKALKFDDPKSLMNDFILNSKKYKRSPYKDLLELSRKTYLKGLKINDEFTSLIIGDNQNKNEIIVKKSVFADKLIKYHKDELKEKDIKKSDINAMENEDLIKELFDEFFINDLNSGNNYILQSVNDKELILKRVFNTFENVYGWNLQTISDLLYLVEDGKDQDIIGGEYRGYLIYHKTEGDKKTYFCSRDSITNKSMCSESFSSLKDVKSFIDKQYNLNTRIDQTANIGFKQRASSEQPCVIEDSGFYPEGTVVKSINIDINSKTTLCVEDSELFYGQQNTKALLSKMKEEYKKLLPEEFIDEFDKVINTTEKAGIFLYLINQELGGRKSRDFSNDLTRTKLKEILNTINEKSNDYKYYFIKSHKEITYTHNGFKRKMHRYEIIPVSKRIEYNEIYDRPQPIISELYAISELFKNKFGLEVKILNASEIPEDILDNAKAWIKDGIIYINGTSASSKDLFHEYTHLLLGVIKSQDFEFYNRMIDKIRNSEDRRILNKRIQYKQLYKNISETDLNEEILADVFGKYLAGKDLSFFEDMSEMKKKSGEIMSNAFPGLSEIDLDQFTFGKIDQMFRRLSNLIKTQGGGIQFGDNKNYRKASRLIEKWIENKTLIEDC